MACHGLKLNEIVKALKFNIFPVKYTLFKHVSGSHPDGHWHSQLQTWPGVTTNSITAKQKEKRKGNPNGKMRKATKET